MKKIVLLLFLIGGVFFAWPAFAQEQIDSFDVKIQLNADTSIQVTETIKYNFGEEERHGIYRTIPVKYHARNGNYNLRISGVKIYDENNKGYEYSTSYEGSYIKYKIGSADIYVTGVKTYNISYTIKRAINYFDTYDELYWNATGNEWEVPIKSATAQILMPQPVETLKTTCYIGPQGSTDQCKGQELIKADGLITGAKFTQSNLAAAEGLSVVIALPKNILPQPDWQSELTYILMDNWSLLIPILVFIICYLIWYKYGNDPEGTKIIIAQFDPPDNLNPSQVGTIYDNRTQSKDISAEIINLAVNGFLKINKIDKSGLFKSADYELVKIKSGGADPIQEKILSALFSHGDGQKVKISSLKEKFYSDFKEITENVWDTLIKQKYYPTNYKSAGNLMMTIGGLLAFGTFSAMAIFIVSQNYYLMISLIISGIIIFIFGLLMPKINMKGVLAREYILGLKLYLTVAEKDRIKFHNAPEKNPKEFERLLPYAMVLGVEKQWAQQFKDIYKEVKPSWYNDPNITNFTSTSLINNLFAFKSASAAGLTSTPPSSSSSGSAFGSSGFSSGGGFSGGGFGGGGGGSW